MRWQLRTDGNDLLLWKSFITWWSVYKFVLDDCKNMSILKAPLIHLYILLQNIEQGRRVIIKSKKNNKKNVFIFFCHWPKFQPWNQDCQCHTCENGLIIEQISNLAQRKIGIITLWLFFWWLWDIIIIIVISVCQVILGNLRVILMQSGRTLNGWKNTTRKATKKVNVHQILHILQLLKWIENVLYLLFI